METIPKPVDVFSGETKSPVDCLTPIVIAKIAAELNINTQVDRAL